MASRRFSETILVTGMTFATKLIDQKKALDLAGNLYASRTRDDADEDLDSEGKSHYQDSWQWIVESSTQKLN